MKFSKLAFILGIVTLWACEDPVLTPERSLNGPTAIAIATGDQVCITTAEIGNEYLSFFGECKPGKNAAIGLVVNENIDRLTFVDFAIDKARLINFQQSTPGVTHIEVGRLPVDVAASGDGTAALTLNQIDMDISIVNIWGPSVYPERLSLPRTPIAMETRPITGEIVVAMDSPSRFWIHGGVTCSMTTCDVSTNPIRTQGLRGTVTDFKITPDGSRAYVAYRDLDEIDVIDLDSLTLLQTIPVGYGCADGVDNDGDGFTDTDDPQCFSPFGAEAMVDGGIGRKLLGDCADNLDNDNDGLIDREDPDCVTGSGTEDTRVLVPITECNDGLDNDGDGLADFGQDPDCYGPYGQTETAVPHRGYDRLGIDELGFFVYVLDRTRSSVAVIDATRDVLIDAGEAANPSTAGFSKKFGISVADTPLAVAGTVRRDCLATDNSYTNCGEEFLDDYPSETIVVRFEFGAWVAEDTGRLRQIRVMESFCELPKSAVAQYPGSDFFTDPNALLTSKEADCLVIPEFPMMARDDFAGTCKVDCNDEPDENGFQACDPEVLKTHFYCSNNTNVTINPWFGLADINSTKAFASGKGDCSIPPEVIQSMRFFANEANTPRNFLCSSMLLPQPLELAALDVDRANYEPTTNLRRSDLLERFVTYIVRLKGSIQSQSFSQPIDERVVNERWVVEYEGILPATRRTDGLLGLTAVDLNGTSVVRFSTGGLDLCAADVKVGDVLTIRSTPEADASCDGLRGEADDFLSFSVLKVEPDTLFLGLLGDEFVQELPTRSWFPFGTTYNVRTEGEWVVYGSRSGVIPSTESLFGECVDLSAEADPTEPIDPNQPARGSRVKTGEIYQGPYLTFYLYPGPDSLDDPNEFAIEPERGLVFTFQMEPSFESRSIETGGFFPTQIELFQSAGRYRMTSSDSDYNFVFWKDVRAGGTTGTQLR